MHDCKAGFSSAPLSQSFYTWRKPCLIQEASELEISTGLNNTELYALALALSMLEAGQGAAASFGLSAIVPL